MARVIRGGAGARVIPGVVRDAREQADVLVREARERAERECEALRAELSEQARESARAELAAAWIELERARAASIADAQAAITEIAIAATRRVVAGELEQRPEHVRAIVQGAIDRVQRARRVRVRVHPTDAAQIALSSVEIVEDASIARGGCIVESDIGEVDARLEVRLAAIEHALRSRS